MGELELVRGWLEEARRVVVLTGAGISTDSGIPDFRGPEGVWTKDPAAERASDISHYLSDPALRRRAWERRATLPGPAPEPNAGHRALVDLERTGRLHTLVTQNIDGLHVAAGSAADLVVEIHGTSREFVCLECADRGPMTEALARVRGGEVDPACLRCGGLLKSATISFGQSLVAEDLERALRAARTCDVLLAVGSTLAVFPVAEMVPLAAAGGARIAILNGSPTAMDDLADAVLIGSISEVLPELVAGIMPLG